MKIEVGSLVDFNRLASLHPACCAIQYRACVVFAAKDASTVVNEDLELLPGHALKFTHLRFWRSPVSCGFGRASIGALFLRGRVCRCAGA